MSRPIERALVTGAAGFVGRWLCRDLRERGVWVRALDLAQQPGPWDEFHQCDLRRPAGIGSAVAGVDTVFHLAGLAHSALQGAHATAAYRELNVDATRHLVAAADQAAVARLVMMSSVKALGEGEHGPVDDDTPANPTTDYGRSKLEAERIVLDSAGRKGRHAAVIRSALVYGPGVKGNLRAMCEAVAAGRFPPLAETGNRRSLIDVRDVVAALWLVASRPEACGKAYIVTDGQDYSTRRILDAMRQALGLGSPRLALGPRTLKPLAILGDAVARATRRPAPYDSGRHTRLFGSAEYRGPAIARDLGFTPRFTLEAVAGDLMDPRPDQDRGEGSSG